MKRARLLRIVRKTNRSRQRRGSSAAWTAHLIGHELRDAMGSDEVSRSLVEALSLVHVTGTFHQARWFLHVHASAARKRVAKMMKMGRMLQNAVSGRTRRQSATANQKVLPLEFAPTPKPLPQSFRSSLAGVIGGPFDAVCKECGGEMAEKARVAGGAISYFTCTNSHCSAFGMTYKVLNDE